MSGSIDRIPLAAFAVAAMTVGGCTIESPLAVRRVWADYNTLRTPAIYYEKTSRVPMDSARVRELRWIYNAGPHETGGMTLLPVSSKPSAAMSSAAAPSSASQSSPLPPRPGTMQTPDVPAPPAGPVAAQPPDPGRTARSSDAWRFIH
jgi:hypothetical protein